MIISHARRFVFVKTKKTAGSSLELSLSLSLSSVCGPADVITWLDPDEEPLRTPGPGPQNYRYGWAAVFRAGPAAIRKAARKRRPPIRFRPHTSAAAARELLGPAVWCAYLTFAVERDPYDRIVSLYHWRVRDLVMPPPFSAWLENERDLSNFPLYSADDRPIVDRILRYERLRQDLDELASDLGIHIPDLPRAKSQYRPKGSDSRRIISRTDREIIERACFREMDLLNYEF